MCPTKSKGRGDTWPNQHVSFWSSVMDVGMNESLRPLVLTSVDSVARSVDWATGQRPNVFSRVPFPPDWLVFPWKLLAARDPVIIKIRRRSCRCEWMCAAFPAVEPSHLLHDTSHPLTAVCFVAITSLVVWSRQRLQISWVMGGIIYCERRTMRP